MDTNRIKCVVAYLFLIAICYCFFSFQANASSRGITIKAKTPSGAIKEMHLYSGYHALVVGCGNYQLDWPKLSNPIKDAREVASMLKSMGWSVKLLANPNSTKLQRELNKIVAGPGMEKDNAIFFW